MSENNFKINEHSLRTAISKVEPDKIVTRGYNQRDLIEKIRYSDMVFLLLKGRLPSIKEGKLFNHVLVSFCDHGATPPSTQTARLVASSGSPLNAAVAGALLSFGHKHAGAIEKTMELYQSKIDSLMLTGDADIDNKQIASLAIDLDPKLGLGVFIIGRVPGIIAHIYEETIDEDEFRRFCDIDDIIYDGPGR